MPVPLDQSDDRAPSSWSRTRGPAPSALQVSLPDVAWLPRYSTSRNDLIAQFYDRALERSVAYDRAVGYFRSSFFSLTGQSIAGFALRGGKIRLACSPELTEEDLRALQVGMSVRDVVDSAAVREWKAILAFPQARRTAELLGALTAIRALDVRFITRGEGAGIFHDKVGVFTDSLSNSVSFSGSINESWRAWHPLGNHESFEVFLSWREELPRVEAHRAYFESLWHGNEPGLHVESDLSGFSSSVLELAADDPEEILTIRARSSRDVERPALFDFQNNAIQCWEQRNHRGILRHATGTGKTVTAIEAVRRWVAPGRPSLIVVPSVLLLEQWRSELSRFLGHEAPSVLPVGGGHTAYKKHALVSLHTDNRPEPRIVIATLQTASTDDFLDRVSGGPHLMLVADEVHRVGAEQFSHLLTLEAGARLGLSATPERYGDTDGTAKIRHYFGDDLEPVITLSDAIALGRLCPYEYFAHTVTLNEEERDEWVALTIRIGQAIGSRELTDLSLAEKLLLIRRARIAKKAVAKIARTREIVADNARPGEHWLVYCEDQYQLNAVREELSAHDIHTLEYHSAMSGDPAATMATFVEYGGILCAIRCLDEGVDIPAVSHALILASSQNPREYIQRRGRILRIAPGKRRAVVHDILVTPPAGDSGSHFDRLIAAELSRAWQFALDAVNRAAALSVEAIAVEYGIDLRALADVGEERSEEDE